MEDKRKFNGGHTTAGRKSKAEDRTAGENEWCQRHLLEENQVKGFG